MVRRLIIAVVAVFVLAAAPVASQSVGGGISVWLPESLYTAGEGSVGMETSFGSSVGFGELISFPFGVVYNQVYALTAETEGTLESSPWFYADALSGYLMAKLRLPLGDLYIDLFGGVTGLWNVTLYPLVKNIERDSAPSGSLYSFEAAPAVTGGRFGWGSQAGGGLGIRIDAITVDLNVTYRHSTPAATI
ncbi:MAG: hypothetical protein ACOC1U_09770, partial [Spirochaetota bacterium]